MQKVKMAQWRSHGLESSHRFWATLYMLLGILLSTSGLYAQMPCMVTCGTQRVACEQVQNLLCGTFTGSIDIVIQDPDLTIPPLPVTSIDVAVVLDDLGPGTDQWRGYVDPTKSLVYPITNPEAEPAMRKGPSVTGSNQSRRCTQAAPCFLRSEYFNQTRVSGIAVQRQFELKVTQIEYEDEKAGQTPRALVGEYKERINNYIAGQTIEVNGTFRLVRPTSLASRVQ